MHFVLLCEALSEERRKLSNYINLVDGWQCGGESDRLKLNWSMLVVIKEWEESWRRCGEADLIRGPSAMEIMTHI